MSAWIGVDPGYATGFAVRRGGALLAWDIVTARGPVGPGEVLNVATLDRIVAVVVRLAGVAVKDAPGEVVRVAVEGLNRPGGFIGGNRTFVRPGDLLAPAVVLGLIRGVWPTAYVVPPARHGRDLLGAYPPDLITPGERRHGIDRAAPQSSSVRHARSAWDIAGHAARLHEERTP